MHDVEVRQLNSEGGSFLNTDCGMGWVSVWTHVLDRPTALLRMGDIVQFAQFDSEEWLQDWLDNQPDGWEVTRISPSAP